MARVALVTGGTRGIGAAISEALHVAGRKVIASYVGNDTAAQSFSEATGITVMKFDACDFASCEKAVETIGDGHGPVEILVNNAGITRDGTMSRMTRDMWDAVLDTNLGSCFNLCKLTFDMMRVAKFGRVVNIGSINGQAGQYGQVNYAAAKSGIHGFTKALAQEGARLRHHGERNCAGLCRHRHGARRAAPDVLTKIIARIPVGRLGSRDGYCPRRGVPDGR